uniref:Uncharacterized protein n=1 Tax=Spumella elongata TaxID=89044 RepID=A0A7S3HES9_9STRA
MDKQSIRLPLSEPTIMMSQHRLSNGSLPKHPRHTELSNAQATNYMAAAAAAFSAAFAARALALVSKRSANFFFSRISISRIISSAMRNLFLFCL